VAIGLSSDSDDEDGNCCEGDDDDGMDDLSARELEELQGDIISAIENFDRVYN
jgi:hypothetical protein